ncbi:hypothetical protein BUALT_Bualt06G0145100 [Buddleja alternifolia]|uniref:Major facilitator superfamily (MFS) profile domain-containing protein n=1 Tax=Buddleja alternifolia TaxID=168488 RepID=A0AAV6XJG7_9LAMI|nr:hypothetical protein BUALT_Bualt06G0145100 [Buddleja alternifolia]
MASDVERPPVSFRGKNGRDSGESDGVQEPLLKNEIHEYEEFSVVSAILPFLFPAFGGLLYGYDIGATSSATISIQSETLSGISWYNLSSVDVGLITSGSLYGALIGSILAFNIADFLGRRRELVLSSCMYLIGALLTALAPNFVLMVIGRLIYGIGIGLMDLLRAIQGKGEVQGLRETAITCLCRLRGEAIADSAPQKVDEILSELSHLREEEEATFSEMFQGKCLKALTIGGGLVLFQQITGQPSVLYYAATIFQSAGFSAASDATKVSTLLGLLKLIMTGVAVLVVDRLGRRPLLLGGVSGIVVSLFLLGSYYTYLDDIHAVAVVALLVYVGCYQISFGPIGWLMISEIFPLRVRGRGLSIAVLVNFGANALVTFAFSPLKDLLGAGIVFFIFGGIAVLSLIFIYFIIPETKGLTLEEIEAKLL